jgi:cystathionine beta-lyase/cystathionine gamma-synthase
MLPESYLDPHSSPRERPRLEDMHPQTVALHRGIDDAIRRSGVPYLHPEGRTLQLDLLGSRNMVAWQEGKAAFMFSGEGCWSSLPQVYARYGTETTRELLEKVRDLEHARAAVLADCGMQACALLFDVLVRPGSHAVVGRQSYNKTRKYIEHVSNRVGGSCTFVDDGDWEGMAAALRPETSLIFAETFTNPLTRALDPERFGRFCLEKRRAGCRGLRLVIDNTIATPWALRKPMLDNPGVDFVVAAGTKALAGQDRDLWGYIASNDVDVLNEVMDLQAMRGGILDWRRGEAITARWSEVKRDFERRCATASRVAAFLASHPRVSEVWHPSLPGHPDRDTVAKHYQLPGSLLSFRVRDLDEDATKHFCDVLVTCIVPRYALSFDGLATKVNHHRTVSEYFTPVEELERMGIDRLVRIGVGLEAAEDLIACLNWALWHHDRIRPEEVDRWQEDRARGLGIAPPSPLP